MDGHQQGRHRPSRPKKRPPKGSIILFVGTVQLPSKRTNTRITKETTPQAPKPAPATACGGTRCSPDVLTTILAAASNQVTLWYSANKNATIWKNGCSPRGAPLYKALYAAGPCSSCAIWG